MCIGKGFGFGIVLIYYLAIRNSFCEWFVRTSRSSGDLISYNFRCSQHKNNCKRCASVFCSLLCAYFVTYLHTCKATKLANGTWGPVYFYDHKGAEDFRTRAAIPDPDDPKKHNHGETIKSGNNSRNISRDQAAEIRAEILPLLHLRPDEIVCISH